MPASVFPLPALLCVVFVYDYIVCLCVVYMLVHMCTSLCCGCGSTFATVLGQYTPDLRALSAIHECWS